MAENQDSVTNLNRLIGGASAGNGTNQQTFLGASIASFSISAGFGSNSSTLGVELAEDQYNGSDGTPRGQGADVYHRGRNAEKVAFGDRFYPPTVGAPVYFNFGQKRATVNDAYWNVLTNLYGVGGLRNNSAAKYYGSDHFTFGGILQSFTQNKNATGSALYSVKVTDPRDILANTTLILNNYGGTTFNNDNLINIYGFLEHNTKISDQYAADYRAMKYADSFQPEDSFGNAIGPVIPGLDVVPLAGTIKRPEDVTRIDFSFAKKIFPLTGTGYSRRSDYGIPWYRVAAAINYLAGWWGPIAPEYAAAGFGGSVNFRKMDYAVDFSSLPSMPFSYQLEYDSITLLDLALEICEINSCDLFVSLLPVTTHPAFAPLIEINDQVSSTMNQATGLGKYNGVDRHLIGGVIKVQALSRKNADVSTANMHKIRNYISATQSAGVPIEARDVGYELTNTTTDKFLVGGQEVNMHLFNTYLDRNQGPKEHRLADIYDIRTTLKQQMIPYYGMINKRGVTLPKGFGAFQQIPLDTTGLFAAGVGNYYITTEAELRACLISYDRWKDFLMLYNDRYVQSTEGNDVVENIQLQEVKAGEGIDEFAASIGSNYEVTAPRCLWPGPTKFSGGLPISPCHPPFGYPLYWKRATQLGIPEGGLVSLTSANTRIMEYAAKLKNARTANARAVIIDDIIRQVTGFTDNPSLPKSLRQYFQKLKKEIEQADEDGDVIIIMNRAMNKSSNIVSKATRFAQKNKTNAMRVYSFLKKIADECLGKKFLVKLPRITNKNFSTTITPKGQGADKIHITGPYGFPPRNINQAITLLSYDSSVENEEAPEHRMLGLGIPTQYNSDGSIRPVTDPKYYGALDGNWNPMIQQYEFNYTPVNQGGYIDYNLLQRVVPDAAPGTPQALATAIYYGLQPADLGNFIDDANRLSAYVRFDDAQNLSFDGIGQDNMTQQQQVGRFVIPDVSFTYENYDDGQNKITFAPDGANAVENGKVLPQRSAYVKCDVDPNLYMTYTTSLQSFPIYGEVKAYDVYDTPKAVIDPDNPCAEKSYRRVHSKHHVPTTSPIGGEGGGVEDEDGAENLENAEGQEGQEVQAKGTLHWSSAALDPNHVWALITLPSRVVPTLTSRYNDSMSLKYNMDNFRSLLKQDTEIMHGGGQYFPPPTNIEDTLPVVAGKQVKTLSGEVADLDAGQRILYEKTFTGLTFGCYNRIQVTSPSPVYPNLIALPLESKTRCYGPWTSTATSAGKVGGKIEFIKDDNLTPWNQGGWDLMNYAGKLKVDLENSISLMTERGGFTMTQAPSGLSLATALTNMGPLISNMSIQVGPDGVKTTIQMDLYTQKFGKLTKQLEKQIDSISRERQKLTDLLNRLTRQGIGKMSTYKNFSKMYERFGVGQNSDGSEMGYDTFDRGGPDAGPADTFIKSLNDASDGSDADGGMFSSSMLGDAAQMLGQSLAMSSYYNSASLSITDDYYPVSLNHEHGGMIPSSYRTTATQRTLYSDSSDYNASDGSQDSNTVFG